MTTGRCECVVLIAAQFDHGHEPGKCGNALSEPKNAICRPCAKGWHSSVPCHEYLPEPLRHLVRACRRCGFDSARHPMPKELGG